MEKKILETGTWHLLVLDTVGCSVKVLVFRQRVKALKFLTKLLGTKSVLVSEPNWRGVYWNDRVAFQQIQNSQTPLRKQEIRYSPASSDLLWVQMASPCPVLQVTWEMFQTGEVKWLLRSEHHDFSNSVQAMTCGTRFLQISASPSQSPPSHVLRPHGAAAPDCQPRWRWSSWSPALQNSLWGNVWRDDDW